MRRIISGIMALITAVILPLNVYANPKDNQVAPSALYGSRINMSLDQKSVKFSPHYFDPNKLYVTSTMSLASIPGLSSDALSAARQVISGLSDMNLSTAMIAGILGNLKIESDFIPTVGEKKTFYGLVQWGRERRAALETLSDYNTIAGQTTFLKAELLGTSPATMDYGAAVNRYLAKYASGATMQTIEDVDMATEAFCVEVEGCINTSSYSGPLGTAADGKQYQGLNERKDWANKFYNYLSRGGVAGSISGLEGMTNAQMLQTIFGVSSGGSFDEIMRSLGFNNPHSASQQNRMESTYLTTGTYKSGGSQRTFTVNKFICEDAQVAIQALSDSMGARGASLSVGGYDFRYIGGTSTWSFHSSGLAFDCNWKTNPCKRIDHNPAITSDVSALLSYSAKGKGATEGIYNPDKDITCIRPSDAEEMISRGFLWGRDFGGKPDMMHFSVAEASENGRNKALTDYFTNQ